MLFRSVGGSTTDQRYIDNNNTWDQVLRDKLKNVGKDVVIVNAGVDGQSTFGHIKNLDIWFPKIKGLRPKYILYYVGINDFYKEANNVYDTMVLDKGLKQMIKSSFVYYLARTVKSNFKARFRKINHGAIKFNAMEVTHKPLNDPSHYSNIMKARLAAYQKRLEVLIYKTREMGAEPIFVTQPRMVAWTQDGVFVGIKNEFPYDDIVYNGLDLFFMNKVLNQTTIQIAKQYQCDYIDLESELVFEFKDFYDFVHHTPSGSYKIGHYLFNKLKDIF